MESRESFVQRLAGALVIPLTILPVAAILMAAGDQLQMEPVRVAGLALITFWLPLFFAMSIALNFGGGEGMAVITAAAGYLVAAATAEVVAGDPALNLGVLGGVLVGVLVTALYNRVKRVRLPEYLALFTGARLGPAVAAVAGILLGALFGWGWAPFQQAVLQLGHWVAQAGAAGAFVYGAVLRLLVPTGLHHLLIQLVDTQLGSFTDPTTGKVVTGELLRFLAGDRTAGHLQAGHFILCFTVPAVGLAMVHEAPPERRGQVRSLMWTGALTAALLGVTEPIEFSFLFGAPFLWGLHALLQGAAAWAVYAAGIRHGGYALPMYLVNYHLSERGWLILPIGLAFGALYYLLFRLLIRVTRPALATLVGADVGRPAPPVPDGEAPAYLHALGGTANLVALTACMTRLRVQVRDEAQVDEAALRAAGAVAVVRKGGGAVQVVVGARAGALADDLHALAPTGALSGRPSESVILLSPLSGEVVPLDEVEDEVFAQRLAGDGVAVRALGGEIRAPVAAKVAHLFPGGHAIGLEAAHGLELLIHVGIGTVELRGEGFAINAQEGDRIEAAALLGRVDLSVLQSRGKSAVSPILITNAADVSQIEVLATGRVEAGAPLLRVTPRAPTGPE